jgi:hypothetical protein
MLCGDVVLDGAALRSEAMALDTSSQEAWIGPRMQTERPIPFGSFNRMTMAASLWPELSLPMIVIPDPIKRVQLPIGASDDGTEPCAAPGLSTCASACARIWSSVGAVSCDDEPEDAPHATRRSPKRAELKRNGACGTKHGFAIPLHDKPTELLERP